MGADGKPIYRESDNKVLKGPNFEEPDFEGVLINAGWQK
nr:MAG TPA: NTP-PPase-like protein [Caudoviricetes sp.]